MYYIYMIMEYLNLKNIITFLIIITTYKILFKKKKERNISYFLIFVSKLVVFLAHLKPPVIIRPLYFKLMIKIFKINKDEMLDQNLKNYSCFSDMFIRQIKVIYILYIFF
jgi:hypothetical protein